MKDKSFKSSFRKMYMVPPELYNRLLNIAEPEERKNVQTENGDETEMENVNVPSPYDELKSKISEIEQKVNLLSKNETETMDEGTQTDDLLLKSSETQTDETKTNEGQTPTEIPTQAIETQTEKKKKEEETEMEHEHITQKKQPEIISNLLRYKGVQT